MDLNTFIALADRERAKREEALRVCEEKYLKKYLKGVKAYARRIRLRDIIGAIEFSPDSDRQFEHFENGQTLDIRIRSSYFKVSANPKELILVDPSHKPIARFGGPKVKSFYDSCSREIQKAMEEERGIFNIPY